jgi:hypothetical protein
MAKIELPPTARLLFEVAALRLKVKMLERDIADLKARVGERDDDEVRETPA